jgi:hypothetical protein
VRSGTRLMLGTRTFKNVTGIHETENGKSADVEYSWRWKLRSAGERLDGATIPAFADDAVQPGAVSHRGAGLFKGGAGLVPFWISLWVPEILAHQFTSVVELRDTPSRVLRSGVTRRDAGCLSARFTSAR